MAQKERRSIADLDNNDIFATTGRGRKIVFKRITGATTRTVSDTGLDPTVTDAREVTDQALMELAGGTAPAHEIQENATDPLASRIKGWFNKVLDSLMMNPERPQI